MATKAAERYELRVWVGPNGTARREFYALYHAPGARAPGGQKVMLARKITRQAYEKARATAGEKFQSVMVVYVPPGTAVKQDIRAALPK